MDSAIEIYNNEPRCGTFIISQGFEREHFKVLRLIEKYKERFFRADNKRLSKSFIMRRVPAKKAGRPTDEIMLNEQQTIFLGTLFRNTERVLDFKEELARDFVKQKKIILALINQRQTPEWIENRAVGIPVRKDSMDVVKDFQEYCIKQGSLNFEKYYLCFSKAINDGLFDFNGTFQNKREAMTANQLRTVKFGDSIVAKGIIEGMALEMHYKDIYTMVKDRLITLGEMCGRGEVVSQQLMLFD